MGTPFIEVPRQYPYEFQGLASSPGNARSNSPASAPSFSATSYSFRPLAYLNKPTPVPSGNVSGSAYSRGGFAPSQSPSHPDPSFKLVFEPYAGHPVDQRSQGFGSNDFDGTDGTADNEDNSPELSPLSHEVEHLLLGNDDGESGSSSAMGSSKRPVPYGQQQTQQRRTRQQQQQDVFAVPRPVSSQRAIPPSGGYSPMNQSPLNQSPLVPSFGATSSSIYLMGSGQQGPHVSSFSSYPQAMPFSQIAPATEGYSPGYPFGKTPGQPTQSLNFGPPPRMPSIPTAQQRSSVTPPPDGTIHRTYSGGQEGFPQMTVFGSDSTTPLLSNSAAVGPASVSSAFIPAPYSPIIERVVGLRRFRTIPPLLLLRVPVLACLVIVTLISTADSISKAHAFVEINANLSMKLIQILLAYPLVAQSL